jgi:hypothetical protein
VSKILCANLAWLFSATMWKEMATHPGPPEIPRLNFIGPAQIACYYQPISSNQLALWEDELLWLAKMESMGRVFPRLEWSPWYRPYGVPRSLHSWCLRQEGKVQEFSLRLTGCERSPSCHVVPLSHWIERKHVSTWRLGDSHSLFFSSVFFKFLFFCGVPWAYWARTVPPSYTLTLSFDCFYWNVTSFHFEEYKWDCNYFYLFIYYFCSTGIWTQGLHLPRAIPPALFSDFFWDRVSQNYFPRLTLNLDPPDLCLLSS